MDVIDMKSRFLSNLRQAAVFTPIASALDDLPPKFGRNVGHQRPGGGTCFDRNFNSVSNSAK